MTGKGGKHGLSDDPQKVSGAGGKGSGQTTGVDVKRDRAERARTGGQHSHGDIRRGGH